MTATVVERRMVPGGWCFLCGRTSHELIVVYLPCPHCTVPVAVRLCKDCARELAESILRLLGEVDERSEG